VSRGDEMDMGWVVNRAVGIKKYDAGNVYNLIVFLPQVLLQQKPIVALKSF
jgi:hypothetical protein